MRMLLASNNSRKAAELSELLSELGITAVTMREAGFVSDPEETGKTFSENAAIKARALFTLSGEAVIADDSGLSVDALDGAPGVYSARFAGENATDAENNAKLLSALTGVPCARRGAAFFCHITAILPDGRILDCEEQCRGEILSEPRGEGGFGYDPLFYLPELCRTMAEISAAEKNAISHRGRALRTFAAMLSKELEEKPL